MSDAAYCLYLCRRALVQPYWQARPISLARFEARCVLLAQRLIGAQA